MPDFSNAEISTTGTEDLTPYRTFLRRLTVGQTVTLPLEPGESPRRVRRALNRAATQSHMRLARLPAVPGAVRFRVLAPEKRRVHLTDEAERARAEKAQATRAARRIEHHQLAATGMPAEGETPPAPTTSGRRRRRAPDVAETA